MGVDQRGTARELSDLGDKVAAPHVGDRREMTEGIVANDTCAAAEQDEQAGCDVAGHKERRAPSMAPNFAEMADPARNVFCAKERHPMTFAKAYRC